MLCFMCWCQCIRLGELFGWGKSRCSQLFPILTFSDSFISTAVTFSFQNFYRVTNAFSNTSFCRQLKGPSAQNKIAKHNCAANRAPRWMGAGGIAQACSVNLVSKKVIKTQNSASFSFVLYLVFCASFKSARSSTQNGVHCIAALSCKELSFLLFPILHALRSLG